ncbi:MAG: M48 family metallopeptidase [Solirubrobacterales bacterium]
MRRELKFALIILILTFAAFTFILKYTENTNTESIKQSTVQLYKGDDLNKALSYQEKKVDYWILNTAISFIIPLLFVIAGLSAALRNGIIGSIKYGFISLGIFFCVYSLINYILTLPLDYYGGYYLKHSFGLSNQEFLKWFLDSFKGFLVNTIISTIVVICVYMIIRSTNEHWWLYTGLLSIPLLFFLTFITPVYIDPIFNKYEVINNKSLEISIKDELKNAGIENCNVFKVIKSGDTKEMNAYMTGVMSTKRIVLWDTTINNLTQREVLSVTAHEIGHYVMGHIWKAILLGGAFTIVILFFTNKAVLWIIEKSGGCFGFNSIKDIAVLPLIILIINIFMFIAAPLVNAYSRYTEKEADRFELELTKDNDSALSSTLKLHQGSLIIPTPGVVYKLWNYDHPTLKERVDFDINYTPWKEGKPLKYEKYFEKR